MYRRNTWMIYSTPFANMCNTQQITPHGILECDAAWLNHLFQVWLIQFKKVKKEVCKIAADLIRFLITEIDTELMRSCDSNVAYSCLKCLSLWTVYRFNEFLTIAATVQCTLCTNDHPCAREPHPIFFFFF